MELKILNEKDNPLFKRKEILSEIESETTPRLVEVTDVLSKKFSVPLENINIKNIKGKFGTKTFKIKANIYESFEDKERTEIKTQKQRIAEKKANQERIKTEKEAKNVEEEAKSQEVKAEKSVEETSATPDKPEESELSNKEDFEAKGEAKSE